MSIISGVMLLYGLAAFVMAYKARKDGLDIFIFGIAGLKFTIVYSFLLLGPLLRNIVPDGVSNFIIGITTLFLLLPNWILIISFLGRGIFGKIERNIKIAHISFGLILLILPLLVAAVAASIR